METQRSTLRGYLGTAGHAVGNPIKNKVSIMCKDSKGNSGGYIGEGM